MFNIVMGLICIVGGLSGELALLGTDSPTALIVVGVVIGGIGVRQVMTRNVQ